MIRSVPAARLRKCCRPRTGEEPVAFASTGVVEWEGKVTGKWLSGRQPPPGNWKLCVGRVIAL